MAKKNLTVYLLPKRWVIPFLAAYRVMERSLNPAFTFILRCAKCGKMGGDKVKYVMSRKNPEAIIGLQCENCGQTVKLEGMIDPKSKGFPKRLRKEHPSVLEIDGKTAKDGDLDPGDVTKILFKNE